MMLNNAIINDRSRRVFLANFTGVFWTKRLNNLAILRNRGYVCPSVMKLFLDVTIAYLRNKPIFDYRENKNLFLIFLFFENLFVVWKFYAYMNSRIAATNPLFSPISGFDFSKPVAFSLFWTKLLKQTEFFISLADFERRRGDIWLTVFFL